MSRIFVSGLGAVSPAGWGVPLLRGTLENGQPLQTCSIARPGWNKPLLTLEVPEPLQRPAFYAHPRYRRASPITLHAAGAAMEALDSAGATGPNLPSRLGVIMCMLSGCVRYSHRFFDETLKDPATASPLVFPETVFNAPASHLAAFLGKSPVTYTLLGDPATFLQGLALAASWLEDDRVDGCLVVGAEETNWLLADVLWNFDHRSILSGGAGALYLTKTAKASPQPQLELITDPQIYSRTLDRARAALQMRRALTPSADHELLCDSSQGGLRIDKAERAAWKDWTGPRLSPKTILGDGLMASGAWQCVAACDALAHGKYSAANISIVGANQQAIGARFTMRSEVCV